MTQEDHVLVLKRLRKAVELNLRELHHAKSQRPISTVAWVARNLLELSIWVEYCKSSQERAKRFSEDSARDALGMLDIPSEGFSGDQTFNFRAERERLIEQAKQLGMENPDDSFLRVSKAAEELGQKQKDEFINANKLFSKFAHPTAVAVMDFVPAEAIKHFKKEFYKAGLSYGNNALAQIDSFK